jgi:signal transduction histidine kinase
VLALALGAGGASSDLLSIAGLDAPRVAVFGLVGAALLLAALAFRLELLEGVRGIVLVNAVAVVALVTLLHVLLVSIAPDSLGTTATIGVAITVAALATLRPVVSALAEERHRTQRLVTMGRFSAQMAHDLRNPLAAIRGAAQFLAEEKRRGGSIDEHAAFVDLILEQTDRLGKVVSDYQRLGRAEASRATVDVAALVRRLESGARVSSSGEAITAEVPERLEHPLDEDLVMQALENLVRNAREASNDGAGNIEIAARKRGTTLELSVRDHGQGMDARTRERALDEFFTTKTTGSGLGLAFVLRVAEAHGGRVTIQSARGAGTTVTMHLPEGPASPAPVTDAG